MKRPLYKSNIFSNGALIVIRLRDLKQMHFAPGTWNTKQSALAIARKAPESAWA